MNHGRAALVAAALLAAALGLAACGGGRTEPPAALSPARRDSVLSESGLPGAAAVGGALDAADSARVRARRAEEAAGR